jgi:hypothetical protein
MQTNFSDVEQRVKRYWFSDGIAELSGGVMFLLLGIYFALQQFLGQDSTVGGLLQAGLALMMIGGAYISRRMVNSLKTRITYPRTGYVEYQTDPKAARSRPILVMLLAFAVSALSIAFVRMFQSFDSMVAVTGVVVGMILVLLRAKVSGLARFYILGAVSMILGILLSVSGLPNGYSLGLFYGLMGVFFMISGGLTLQHYLSENPLPEEERNG